jgi:hypothetical protein
VPVVSDSGYVALVDRVRAAVADGSLELVEASLPLERIEPGQPLPAHRRHTFSCPACAQVFILEVGKPGRRDRWRVLHGN